MFIVDRIEDGWLVVETPDKRTFSLPRELCQEAREGSAIKVTVSIDEEMTKKRKTEMMALLDNFFDR